jgi:geranylgeranyl diphosphate synthase, type I
MTTQTTDLGRIDTAEIREVVTDFLDDFLTEKRENAVSSQAERLPNLLAEFITGGKRIRPLLTVIGWVAAGGNGDRRPAVQVAASLEMFHAFTLIHDDIMDESDTRRGRRTAHRQLSGDRLGSQAEHFGVSAAILLGDLAFAWSDEILHRAALTPVQFAAVLSLIGEMRNEVMLGQYLDLRGTGALTDDVEATLTVSRYKTAKYTVERPLHIGAALAGADPAVMDACTAYALPLGEAFQLRDDLLGVYGDVTSTGKSRLDDLRAGKNTTLVSLALRTAGPKQAARLRGLIGNPRLDEAEAEQVREVFAETGAKDTVEAMIENRYRQSVEALKGAPFAAEALFALQDLARTATRRTS